MRERWHIYVHHVGNVTTTLPLIGVPFQTDLDAPFVLRGRAFSLANPTGLAPDAIFSSRFTDAYGNYRSNDFIPASFDTGIQPAPGPVYPQLVYPAGSQIITDLQNTGSQTGDLTVLYFGVKLFGDDAEWPTYPKNFTTIDFSYTLYIPNFGVSESRSNIIKQIAGDADYVIRGAWFGPTQQPGGLFGPPQPFTNLQITIKDFQWRAFSSAGAAGGAAGVDAAWLFPFVGNTGVFANAIPGLVVPEIYLRANQQFSIDLVRADGAVTSPGVAVTQDLQLVLRGSKVYPR